MLGHIQIFGLNVLDFIITNKLSFLARYLILFPTNVEKCCEEKKLKKLFFFKFLFYYTHYI